jgi:hypothetical protein
MLILPPAELQIQQYKVARQFELHRMQTSSLSCLKNDYLCGAIILTNPNWWINVDRLQADWLE